METPENPPTFGVHRPAALGGRPPLNGGSPKKPKAPPPTMAPPQADPMAGAEQATTGAARRKGLRQSIISQMAGEQNQQTLGAPTALGRMGKQ